MATKKTTSAFLALVAIAFFLCRCSPLNHIRKMDPEKRTAVLSLPDNGSILDRNNPSENGRPTELTSGPDSMIVRNVNGQNLTVMRTIRDSTGEDVAHQVLTAAKVTARFRNVAERRGKIRLEFLITVPEDLQHKQWQLRYTPVLFLCGDSLFLDKILVTGNEYRKKQLRGYQQYQRFLNSIVSDSSAFIHTELLEVFIKRNIPELHAFSRDSNFVSDEEFRSAFGISVQEATRHYTDWLALDRNKKKSNRKDEMFHKLVKSPISHKGIRLDTITAANGVVSIPYVETIATRPGLKKVDVALDGGIFEQNTQICGLSRSNRISFYVSSLSSFVDETPRWITQIIERQAKEISSYHLEFRSGSSALDLSLGHNDEQISEIKDNLKALTINDDFELDSVSITAGASPEGRNSMNRILSKRRSDAIGRYFSSFLDHKLLILTESVGEDWEWLDRLVNEDFSMNGLDKTEYFKLRGIADPDKRERQMSLCSWYPKMREQMYPSLRSVKFTFHLHRRNMVKDTIHTDILDSLYMKGVQALKDRDYVRAVEILRPYNDYNTAVAFCASDLNHSSLAILEGLEESARTDYLMAIIFSRLGDDKRAVERYLRSCSLDASFIHRGNLDPEIYRLIQTYNLNKHTQL